MTAKFNEYPLVFDCNGAKLVAIIHDGAQENNVGVLIVVGGPQYRIGSHRQFVKLARYLRGHGYHVMRFDYRGMGDSDGKESNFEDVNDDIRSAINTFIAEKPVIDKIVIWGLCDAASAALFYACRDARVSGLVLLNPWVRTEETMAKAYLRHYYIRRIFEISFWKKLLSLNFDIARSLQSFMALIRKSKSSSDEDKHENHKRSLPGRMEEGLRRFSGKVLFVLSGHSDFVANEFRDLVSLSSSWKKLLQRNTVGLQEIPEADHTFSSEEQRRKVEILTRDWLDSNLQTKCEASR